MRGLIVFERLKAVSRPCAKGSETALKGKGLATSPMYVYIDKCTQVHLIAFC